MIRAVTKALFASAVVVALSFFACAALADAAAPKWHELTPDYSYEQYLVHQGKVRPADPAEYKKREHEFRRSLAAVLTHNANPAALYRKGINHMSDLTDAERKRMRGGRVMQMARVAEEMKSKASFKGMYKPRVVSDGAATLPLPPSFDVRGRVPSIMTAVKNQGECGSCWCFASTEAIESYWAAATGDLFVLSTQQATACAPNPNACGGTGGCQGGIFQLVADYVSQAGGMSEEWYYPYTAFNGTTGTCRDTIGDKKVRVAGYHMIEPNKQTHIMDALVTNNAPIVVNVDASAWSDYEGGIFDGCDYAKNISIDHVVNLVGYGEDVYNGQVVRYWTIRNSWSASYGEHGYIRIIRHQTEQCGTNVDNQDGVGCNGQPSTVTTCCQCGMCYSTGFPIVNV